jgi:hypothetical protein
LKNILKQIFIVPKLLFFGTFFKFKKLIMEKRLIECVPNFSEGRDMSIIKQITDVIESHKGVRLLDVDPDMLQIEQL